MVITVKIIAETYGVCVEIGSMRHPLYVNPEEATHIARDLLNAAHEANETYRRAVCVACGHMRCVHIHDRCYDTPGPTCVCPGFIDPAHQRTEGVSP